MRVFVWRRLEDEVIWEAWLENVSDDRMVLLYRGEEKDVIEYAKSVNWALGAGPLRHRDTVAHGHERARHLSEFRLRRMQSVNADTRRRTRKDSYGLLQEV